MKKIFTFLSLVLCAIAGHAQATLEQPEAKVATNITSTGFTANWGAVENAEAYCAFVYKKQKVTKSGEQVIIDEDFSGITRGSIIEPAGGDDMYVDLAEHGFSDTYGWSVYAYPYYVAGMVDGLLYSPYLDLRGDNGHFKIVITSYCTDGDQLRVESHGKDGKEVKFVTTHVANGSTGMSTDVVEFDNGCKDLFFTIINNTAEVANADFIDRVQVLQNLNAGDEINIMVASNETIDATTDWGDDVTSCRFANMPYARGEKTLYYDVYATMHDWSVPSGSMPYTAVYSEFSDMVKVDLSARTSEIVTGIHDVTAESRHANTDTYYNLAGQRIARPSHGMYISNGKKIINK